jgi:hypothetical protein
MTEQPFEFDMSDAVQAFVDRQRAAGSGTTTPALRWAPGDAWASMEGTTRIVKEPAALGKPEVVVVERRGEDDRRPALNVTNKSVTLGWMMENLGRENLPGYFIRDAILVRVPRTGTEEEIDGEEKELTLAEKRELAEKEGPAQVKSVRNGALISHVHKTCWPFTEKADVEGPKGSRHAERITYYRTPELFPSVICPAIIEGAPDWGTVPRITAITHTPMLRHDGSVILDPGYDARSGVLYLPSRELSLFRTPTAGAITEGWITWARTKLEYVFQDFPFESDTHRSHMYALLLTPLMRRVIGPPYPMFLFNAHQRGTGKSLLAKIAGALHGIVHRPDLSPDDEEIRKVITTTLLNTTAPIVNFDNITSMIKSGQIANLLTTRVWTDRKMGGNDNVDLTNDRLWIATGNGIQIGGDMERRVRWVTLDAAVARPEERTGFKEDRLVDFVEQERGVLLAALLVVLGAWVQRGMPRAKLRRSDDYGDWTAAMTEILGGAGLGSGFGERASVDPTMSEDEVELGVLLGAIEEVVGVGVPFKTATLREAASGMGPGGPAHAVIVMDALPSVVAIAKDTWKSLGRYLARKEKTFVDDTRVRKVGEAKRLPVYVLEKSPR